MSYYISTSTAEIAYYNDLTDTAKDVFHYKMTGKHFNEISDQTKEMFSKLSINVRNYIETEDIKEQEKLWLSYDKYTQYLCDQDKHDQFYNI